MVLSNCWFSLVWLMTVVLSLFYFHRSYQLLPNEKNEQNYLRSKGSIQSGAHKKQASEFEFENRSSRKRSDILENAVLEKNHISVPRINKVQRETVTHLRKDKTH